MNKSIGIVGGMGPLATCDLMNKIINHTDASRDQEYIRICVDCNTNIPDRTGAILHGGADPLPEMVKSATRLQAMGADVLVMSCNTAHYFYEQICRFIDIPMLHMPLETAKYLAQQGVKKAAVLATDGTVQVGIYEKALKELGIEPVYPNAEDQKMVMSLIYDYVKAGKPITQRSEIKAMVKRLQAEGAETMILGCTELPIVFAQMDEPQPTVDPTEVLACAAVLAVGGKLK